MLGATTRAGAPKSAAAITALTVIILGAVAFAIPDGPIEIATEQARGRLVSHVDVSDDMAVQFSKSGYSFLAVDVSGADLAKGTHLHRHLHRVAKRYTLWAWIDAGVGAKEAGRLLTTFPFEGVFLYGADAPDLARTLSADEAFDALVIHAVQRADRAPAGAPCVAFQGSAFPGSGVAMPVLLGETLGLGEIEKARAKAEGDYLVTRASLPQLD
jgi:hypothetical protein